MITFMDPGENPVSHVAFKRLYTAICTGCTETSSNAHWRNEKLKVITFKYSVCPIGALVLATPPTFLSPLSKVQTNKETKKKLWKHKIQPFVCTILNLWVQYLGSCHVVVWSQTKGESAKLSAKASRVHSYTIWMHLTDKYLLISTNINNNMPSVVRASGSNWMDG